MYPCNSDLANTLIHWLPSEILLTYGTSFLAKFLSISGLATVYVFLFCNQFTVRPEITEDTYETEQYYHSGLTCIDFPSFTSRTSKTQLGDKKPHHLNFVFRKINQAGWLYDSGADI